MCWARSRRKRATAKAKSPRSRGSKSPGAGFKAARVQKNWQEMQVTWNQAAGGVNWATPGVFDSSDVLPSADGQGTSASATDGYPGWLNLDVTPGVRAFATGSPNYGWK